MAKLTLISPAKLNLFLHITGRRADGYHLLQTVFQLLNYGDEITFQLTESPQILFSCNCEAINNDNNLCVQAARLLQTEAHTQSTSGASITLNKCLPLGSGLGGGSSNAATVLLALNSLWQCKLSVDTLAELGLRLGADVPVFIRGHSAFAEDIGEQLSPLSIPQLWYVVLTPPCEVSTAEIFCHQQLTRNTSTIKIPAFPFSGSKNDCEMVASLLYPEVHAALEWLNQHGRARMTGTGASVFASFNSREKAEQVLKEKPAELKGFVAKGVDTSPLHQSLGVTLRETV